MYLNFKTRYTKTGMIDFTVKHFFSRTGQSYLREMHTDVTQDISPYTITVNKQLKQKNKKQEYVKGLSIISTDKLHRLLQ